LGWCITIPTQRPSRQSWRRFLTCGLLSWIHSTLNLSWNSRTQSNTMRKLLMPPQPQHLPNQEFLNNWFPYQKVNVNLVRWSKNIGTPQFPKNVLLRRTPESIGAWPCKHCCSSFHWDNECKHSRNGEKMVQVDLIQLEDNDLWAQEDYDSLFYNLDSDSEEGSSNKLDFVNPSSVLSWPSNMPT